MYFGSREDRKLISRYPKGVAGKYTEGTFRLRPGEWPWRAAVAGTNLKLAILRKHGKRSTSMVFPSFQIWDCVNRGRRQVGVGPQFLGAGGPCAT